MGSVIELSHAREMGPLGTNAHNACKEPFWQTFNIGRTKSKHLNIFCFILQLS